MTNFINKYVGFNILNAQSLRWGGTIDGVNYYFRSFAALPAIIVAIIALFAGVSLIETGDVGAVIGSIITFLGGVYILLVYVYIIWLGLTTINKRLNALLPNNKVLGWIALFIPYVGIGMSLYLLFANSKIENHNG